MAYENQTTGDLFQENVLTHQLCGRQLNAFNFYGLGQTLNKLKIGATKSRLNSIKVTNVAPASILFHKLHFIETWE